MWIEIIRNGLIFMKRNWSRPARALWIEILRSAIAHIRRYVEAREGLVD